MKQHLAVFDNFEMKFDPFQWRMFNAEVKLDSRDHAYFSSLKAELFPVAVFSWSK
jgi:hypothetical protein